jgi:hypothetical protein
MIECYVFAPAVPQIFNEKIYIKKVADRKFSDQVTGTFQSNESLD